jgi:hypothetical protein
MNGVLEEGRGTGGVGGLEVVQGSLPMVSGEDNPEGIEQT